jgi:hypothetical protein
MQTQFTLHVYATSNNPGRLLFRFKSILGLFFQRYNMSEKTEKPCLAVPWIRDRPTAGHSNLLHGSRVSPAP